MCVPESDDAAGDDNLVVIQFKLTRQASNLATATFIDVLTEDFHGINPQTNFHSTQTRVERADGWRLVASHTSSMRRYSKA